MRISRRTQPKTERRTMVSQFEKKVALDGTTFHSNVGAKTSFLEWRIQHFRPSLH